MQWRVEHDDRAWDGWRREGNHRDRDGKAHHDDWRERVQGFEWQRPARRVRGLGPAGRAGCRGPSVAHDIGGKGRADAHRVFQSDREPQYYPKSADPLPDPAWRVRNRGSGSLMGERL